MLQRLRVLAVGNPEPQYARTRHNAGVEVMNMLAGGAGAFRSRGKYSEASTVIEGAPVTWIKPQGTFMNVNGSVLAPLMRSSELKLVIHDEMSLPVGTVQLRAPGASLRGHRGLRSIKQHGIDDYYRLAVGIDRPTSKDSSVVARYVTSKFPPAEWAQLGTAAAKVGAILSQVARGELKTGKF